VSIIEQDDNRAWTTIAKSLPLREQLLDGVIVAVAIDIDNHSIYGTTQYLTIVCPG
jgi:hypothetical protein